MDPDETTLSDVHLDIQPLEVKTRERHNSLLSQTLYKQGRTRFVYEIPPEKGTTDASTDTKTDQDGDMLICRNTTNHDVIVIDHAMDTRLVDVGLQIWRGSLLLCDFILNNECEFDGCIALELGAGVGLVSITMAIVAKVVVATDIGLDVLTLCQRNVQSNDGVLKASNMITRELDWKKKIDQNTTHKEFSWTKDDFDILGKTEFLLAADVIYDDELTDAFFRTLEFLLCQGCRKTAFISIEKRLNFTLEDLDVACPAYDHFCDSMAHLRKNYNVECINPNSITKYFTYDRIPQLVGIT